MAKNNLQYKIDTIQSVDKKISVPSVSSVVKSAFTLVELMIVVAILGILAAIVLPEFQGHIQQAKEAAAKDNLRILREAIGRYAADHGVPPGYVNGIFSSNHLVVNAQLLYCTNIAGDTILQKTKSGTYIYGPYLNGLPKNPFNNKDEFQLIDDTTDMPLSGSGAKGWIYKPKSKEIRIDYPGVDSQNLNYYNY